MILMALLAVEEVVLVVVVVEEVVVVQGDGSSGRSELIDYHASFGWCCCGRRVFGGDGSEEIKYIPVCLFLRACCYGDVELRKQE